uniref:8 kDa Amblyomma family member n=1 Tax=Rhipicephalus zambeziensis TaxID=60191 RepID=A0A224YZM7_9ACAR
MARSIAFMISIFAVTSIITIKGVTLPFGNSCNVGTPCNCLSNGLSRGCYGMGCQCSCRSLSPSPHRGRRRSPKQQVSKTSIGRCAVTQLR